MDRELLLDMLYIAVLSSFIAAQVIQKIKETVSLGKKFNKIVSLFVSFGVGFCYALSFYTSSILYAIWIGVFTLVGASGLYKTFKGYFGLMSSNNINNIN